MDTMLATDLRLIGVLSIQYLFNALSTQSRVKFNLPLNSFLRLGRVTLLSAVFIMKQRNARLVCCFFFFQCSLVRHFWKTIQPLFGNEVISKSKRYFWYYSTVGEFGSIPLLSKQYIHIFIIHQIFPLARDWSKR